MLFKQQFLLESGDALQQFLLESGDLLLSSRGTAVSGLARQGVRQECRKPEAGVRTNSRGLLGQHLLVYFEG